MNKLLRLLGFTIIAGLLSVLAIVPTMAQEQLPEDDWERVQANGTIVFGTAADYPPFSFYDSNFQLDGFDIALAKELAKRLGVEARFNDFAFGGLLDALQLGQVDAAIAAISVTPDRQQIVDFTNLYFVSDDALLVRGDDQFIRRPILWASGSVSKPGQPTKYGPKRIWWTRGSLHRPIYTPMLIRPR